MSSLGSLPRPQALPRDLWTLGWEGEEEKGHCLHLPAPLCSMFWLGNVVNVWLPRNPTERQWWAGETYLRVPHAGCSDQCLLDGVALFKHSLLLPSHGPVALDQKLHHFQVSPESSVNQSALTVFVQVIHLEKRRRQNTIKPHLGQSVFLSSEFPAPVSK